MKNPLKIIVSILIIGLIVAAYFLFLDTARSKKRSLFVVQFIQNPQKHTNWTIEAKSRCGDAPFIFPTSGLIGYLWNDSFQVGHRHQGIDTFGGTQPGLTPVFATYDGYLTRLADWKSTVIIRIPSDPLMPGRQIWAYYTHMADVTGNGLVSPEFPAGSSEEFVKAGTFLGYQGNYSGTSGNPVGVHLHFSIVKDDGTGHFTNELGISNTLDPSPYFNLPLNADSNPDLPILCQNNPVSK